MFLDDVSLVCNVLTYRLLKDAVHATFAICDFLVSDVAARASKRGTEGQKLCQVMASHVTRKPIAEQYYVMPKYPKNVGLSSRLQHPKFTLKIQGCAKSLE